MGTRRVVRVACRGGRFAVLLLFLLALQPALAVAYDFDLTGCRDWCRAHYDDTLYSNVYYNCCCTSLASTSYHFGAGVPHRGTNLPRDDVEAWWSVPDSWGENVGPILTLSWVNVHTFRDHFNAYPPSGTDWVRVTRHRCNVAPQEDDRWSGGHVVFYHNSIDNLPDTACAEDYEHVGVIYGRHVQSYFGTLPWGTCKVEKTGDAPPDPTYRVCNLINLSDRKTLLYRMCHFVQVNTLVDV